MTTQDHPALPLADFQIEEDLVRDERPTIGVVVSLWFPDMNDASAKMLHDLTLGGVQAVRESGGRPVVIDSADPAARTAGTDWHTEMDGFVYLGGADIHPGFFSDIPFSKRLRGVDPDADKFCIESVQRAVADDAPVLAVCRGSQLLNVAMGGSIIQHLDDHRAVIDDHGNIAFIDEAVTIDPNSRVAEMLGKTQAIVRGAHHQAVEDLGHELRAVAFANDGTVEATEHVDKEWVVGLQWHPEEEHANREDLRKIFGAFIAQTKLMTQKAAKIV